MKKVSAGYAIVMGAGLVVTWIVLLATGQATEFRTTPLQAWSLLAAEALTGITLILGGYALLARRPWGEALHLVSLGMLLYAAIYSIGVFAQADNLPASVFFSVVAVATAALVLLHVGRPGR